MTLPKNQQLAKLLPKVAEEHRYDLEQILSLALDLHAKWPKELAPFAQAVWWLPAPAIDKLARALDRLEQKRVRAEQEKRADLAVAADKKRRDVAAAGAWTLRSEHVKCGRPGCDEPHGPYWYGYRTVSGKVRKKYFGKKEPDQATLKAAAAKMDGRKK